VTLAEKANKTQ